MPGQGPLEQLGRVWAASPLLSLTTRPFLLCRPSWEDSLVPRGTLAAWPQVSVCACVAGGSLGQRSAVDRGGGLGAAQPAVLRDSDLLSLKVQRQKTSQSSLGSFPWTPDLPLPLGLPAFLEGRFCWTVEFSQDRPLPLGLGFSVLHCPPRAGLPLELGVRWRRQKGNSAPEALGFHQYTCPAPRAMCSELGGAQAGFLFIIIFFCQAGWTR